MSSLIVIFPFNQVKLVAGVNKLDLYCMQYIVKKNLFFDRHFPWNKLTPSCREVGSSKRLWDLIHTRWNTSSTSAAFVVL